MELTLEIISPEKKEFTGKVAYVYLPGEDGEIGVLPQHECLVIALKPGELRYKQQHDTQSMVVGYGVAEITHEKVVVLTDMVVDAKLIDLAGTEDAIKRANDKLKSMSSGTNTEEIANLHSSIARSMALIKIKRKY